MIIILCISSPAQCRSHNLLKGHDILPAAVGSRLSLHAVDRAGYRGLGAVSQSRSEKHLYPILSRWKSHSLFPLQNVYIVIHNDPPTKKVCHAVVLVTPESESDMAPVFHESVSYLALCMYVQHMLLGTSTKSINMISRTIYL